MISTPRIAFIVSIAVMLCLATANAVTVAVLELIIINDEMDLSIDETKFLTDEVRRQANVSLPKEYSVLTREKIIDLASKATGNLNTVIEIGVALKSDYVSQGFIGKLGNMFTLTVELYETSSGKLLGYFTKESVDLKGLLDGIHENSPTLFAKTMQKEIPYATAIAPPLVAAPATIPTNIPAAETSKSESSLLGLRGITRIVVFSAATLLSAATISRHIDSRESFKDLDILKNNIFPDNSNNEYKTYNTWKRQYDDKAGEVREKEQQRNVFGILAGVCVFFGGVTFFF